MTCQALLDDCCEFLKNLYADIPLFDSRGMQTELRVFPNALPEGGDDDADPTLENVPYAIVKVLSGSRTDFVSKPTAELIIVFCTYDERADKQGYRDTYNLIDRLQTELSERPLIGKKFTVMPQIKWALAEEDTHPFYLGAVTFSAELPSVGKECNLA